MELGTKLTGRHITKELFPFSYNEYLEYSNQKANANSVISYINSGGFPEFLKTYNEEILSTVFLDILIRDIAIRYQIKQVDTLKILAVFLISNQAKLLSANALRKYFNIASTTTVNEYLNFLIDCYLFTPIPKCSYSQKVQQLNPKKWYAIDTGLTIANSRSFTQDLGRLLETAVFLYFRRLSYDIFYFLEKKECDFVVFYQSQLIGVYQVCYEINSQNKHREVEGLIEAMKHFDVNRGTIITIQQKDVLKIDNMTIEMIPAFEFLLTSVSE
jgi:predicted AAA+ superfamily ATPase